MAQAFPAWIVYGPVLARGRDWLASPRPDAETLGLPWPILHCWPPAAYPVTLAHHGLPGDKASQGLPSDTGLPRPILHCWLPAAYPVTLAHHGLHGDKASPGLHSDTGLPRPTQWHRPPTAYPVTPASPGPYTVTRALTRPPVACPNRGRGARLHARHLEMASLKYTYRRSGFPPVEFPPRQGGIVSLPPRSPFSAGSREWASPSSLGALQKEILLEARHSRPFRWVKRWRIVVTCSRLGNKGS